MPAPNLISIDVGSTFIKGCLINRDETGAQQLVATHMLPTMVAEESLARMIEILLAAIPASQPDKSFELALVGHPPDIASLATSVTRFSHEEALTAAVKRLSSTSTIVSLDIGSHRTLVGLGKFGKVSIESFDYGVGQAGWDFLRRFAETQEVQTWIAANISETDIENYLANKSVYPQMIPMSRKELDIEQALARLILRHVATQLTFPWPEVQLLTVSGALLTQTPEPSQALAMILDGLQPNGVIQVESDSNMTLFSLGAAAEHWSAENYRIGKALLHPTLTPFGTIVCPDVSAHTHQPVKVHLDTGLSTEQLLEVRPNELVQIPLPQSEPAAAISINGKILDPVENRSSRLATGGAAGIIIDGRPRPIALAAQPDQRRWQLVQWDKQLNVHHQTGQIGAAS